MKRIFSFIIAVVIFIFNCVPVFAWEDSNFLTYGSTTIHPDLVVFMTENPNNNYYYVHGRRHGVDFHVVVYSPSNFSLEIDSETNYLLNYVNNTAEKITVYTYIDYFPSVNLDSYGVFSYNHGGDRFYKTVEKIVDSNNNCVSKKFCEPSIYVDPDSVGDYEEDGVVIKGLTSFFNNMINGLKNIVDSILELPTKILNMLKDLFIPNIENMKTSFNNFIDYMTLRFGFTPLINTLQSLVDSVSDDGSSVGAADVKDKFNYTLFDEDVEETFSINLDFSIPFSEFYNSVVKGQIGDYMKGVFFLLLIFYNLSELYFIIRGVRPWKDPAIVTELNSMQAEKAERHRRR